MILATSALLPRSVSTIHMVPLLCYLLEVKLCAPSPDPTIVVLFLLSFVNSETLKGFICVCSYRTFSSDLMDLEQFHSHPLLVLLRLQITQFKVFLEKKCFTPSCRSFAWCTPCRAYKVFSNSSSVSPWDFFSLWTWNRVPPVHSMHILNALLVEFYRTFSSPISSLCLPLHSSFSRVFSNSEASFESVIPSGVHSFHVLSDSAKLRCALLALASKLPMFYCALLARPKETW